MRQEASEKMFSLEAKFVSAAQLSVRELTLNVNWLGRRLGRCVDATSAAGYNANDDDHNKYETAHSQPDDCSSAV